MNRPSYYTPTQPPSIINEFDPNLFLSACSDLLPDKSSLKCDVCTNDDPLHLLYCRMCGIIIHTYCYEVQTFNDTWICQACTYRLTTNERINCRICLNDTGALRQTPEGWIHSICEKWPSITPNPPSTCFHCQVSDAKVVKCEDCDTTFHAYCGLLNGMKLVEGAIRCERHTGIDKKSSMKPARSSVRLNEEIIEEIKIENKENKAGGTYKKQKIEVVPKKGGKKTKKKTKKETSSNEDELVYGPCGSNLYCLKKEVGDLLKANGKHGLGILSLKLEDYLFSKSIPTARGYTLDEGLQKIFKRTEIFYYEFPEIILDYTKEIILK